MSEDEATPHSPGPFQRLAASFIALLQAHLGLFSIEVEEERERLVRLLTLSVIGAGAVLLSLLTLTLAVILLVDEAHRLIAVIVLLATFLIIAVVCLSLAWRGIRHGSPPFEATLEELRRDRERLLP
jgi:uncharacterized membrane protein YqjE